jgi:SAM-dependent methyltransferase
VTLPPSERQRLLVNAGSGRLDHHKLPAFFDSWQQLRVDSDAAVEPDLIADLTDMKSVADASADAVWASHCLEHLYIHQVRAALKEFRRVLRDDGFVCVIVPDIQTVARYVMADQLHEPLYRSAAGPVTPHDMIYGYGAAIADGRHSMAHHCGFTPGMLQHCFEQLPFGEVLLRRRPAQLELAAVARATPAKNAAERAALVAALEL